MQDQFTSEIREEKVYIKLPKGTIIEISASPMNGLDIHYTIRVTDWKTIGEGK